MPEETPNTVTSTPISNGNQAPSVEIVDVTPRTLDEKIASEGNGEPQKEPQKEQISPKLSKLKQREAKVAEREAAADKKLQEAETKAAELAKAPNLLEQLKNKPSKVLKELGLSFNDFAKAVLDETDEETD